MEALIVLNNEVIFVDEVDLHWETLILYPLFYNKISFYLMIRQFRIRPSVSNTKDPTVKIIVISNKDNV